MAVSSPLHSWCHVSMTSHGTVCRRNFLRLSSAGLLASGLLGRLGLLAEDVKQSSRACILVWLGGAPSQLETWDPKPGSKNGGETKGISTRISGVQIAHYWPKMSQRFGDASLIRTIVGKEAAHERGAYHLHTGRRLTGAGRHPSIGSIVAQEIGDPSSDIPNFVSVGSTISSGFLGVQYAPFEIASPGKLPENVAKAVPDRRLKRRLEALELQNSDFAQVGADALVAERKTLYRRAQQMMDSPRLKAFELDGESDATKSAYGENRFGQGLLVARRLVEAKVPFIEVTRGGWDMHNDLYPRMKNVAGEVDQGLAQLLIDLNQRGLLESTLVVCLGEFGRTPKLNARTPSPGRDHWARNFCAVLAGGGIKGGRVVGKTSDNGQEIVDRAVSVEDLFQTLCKSLRVDASKEIYTPEGRPLKIVDGGSAISELLS